MASVLIADDHAVVRAGLKSLLTQDAGISGVGEASTCADLLKQVQSKRWNLLLLDIHLPDCSGMAILQKLRSDCPQMRILVVSGLPEDQYAIEAVRAGAAGFLSKDCAPEDLITAVRRVLNGQRYVSPNIAEKIVAELGRPISPRHEQLSDRERQVFLRLASGLLITAIAQELKVSVKTVSTYRSRILEKMSFKHNSEITSYALRHGLLASQELEDKALHHPPETHATAAPVLPYQPSP